MDDPQRVLIVLLGAIGDVVRALPLLQRVRAGWPRAHIAWAVEPAAAPVLEGHPALNQVIRFERGSGAPAFVRFLDAVRHSHADLVFDLQRHLKSGVTSWCSRAPRRLAFHRRNGREGNWLFNTETVPPMDRFSSKVRQFLAFADHAGLPPAPVTFGLAPSAAESERAGELVRDAGERFAAMFLGSTWPSRYWFAEATARVCRGLHERGLQTVLLGAPADVAFADTVIAANPGRVVNCAGRTSLRDVLAILARTTVAIGPDSGPMHIAAAVGTPVISLWGATSPARSAPFGSEHLVIEGRVPCAPCYLRRCPINRLCMETITPEAVLSRVDQALGARLPSIP